MQDANIKKRNDIEMLRVLSAFLIVWYHTNAIGSKFAYIGLNVFIFLSMYLGFKANNNLILISKAKRFLLPWLSWFFIYGLINTITNHYFIDTSSGVLLGVLQGTSVHLWYMPFIFLVLSFFDLLSKKINIETLSRFSGILSLLTVLLLPLWRDYSINMVYPIPQYFQALPVVLLGIFMAASVDHARSLFMLVNAIFVAFASIWFNEYSIATTYLLTIIIALIVRFNIIDSYTFNLSSIADCTLGIYFIHIIIIRILKHYLDLNLIFITCITFILSLVIVYNLKILLKKHSGFLF